MSIRKMMLLYKKLNLSGNLTTSTESATLESYREAVNELCLVMLIPQQHPYPSQ